MSDNVKVSLTPEALEVNAGDGVQAQIAVQNIGAVVDVFNIGVEGLHDSWSQFSVNRISLFPGDSGSTTVTFVIPRDSSAVAKTYPFTVRVTAQKDTSQVTTVEGQLTVLPFYSFGASLDPQKVIGAAGSYKVELTNTGNADLLFDVDGSDRENACRYSFEPRRPTVGPGDTTDVAVTVEPEKRPLRAPSKSQMFSLTIAPDQEAVGPTTLHGELEITHRLPWWAIPAAIASIIGVVIIVALVVLLVVLSGGPEPDPFLLNPGQDVTFEFELPAQEPMLINVAAKWSGTAETLTITLIRPDASRESPLVVSTSQSNVSFIIDAQEATQGVGG
jgi:hypothetical protein